MPEAHSELLIRLALRRRVEHVAIPVDLDVRINLDLPRLEAFLDQLAAIFETLRCFLGDLGLFSPAKAMPNGGRIARARDANHQQCCDKCIKEGFIF